MTRSIVLTAALVAIGVSSAVYGQRDRSFGRSQEEWCREAGQADVCEVREDTLSNTRVIDLDARGNGGVSVQGWDRPDVHLRARVTVRADSDAKAKSIASQITLSTTGGHIRAEGPSRDSRGRGWRRNWSVSYELEVPRNADLTVNATNGGVAIENVVGRLDLRTVNGGLALADVGGDIRGETTNGGIDVRVGGDSWKGPGLDVRTVNGGVHLALPPTVSAELEVRAVNGGVHVDYPVTVSGLISSRREIRGTIGSGGPRIHASAVNGGVTITKR
jgi:hypothetical protein